MQPSAFTFTILNDANGLPVIAGISYGASPGSLGRVRGGSGSSGVDGRWATTIYYDPDPPPQMDVLVTAAGFDNGTAYGVSPDSGGVTIRLKRNMP